MAKDSIQKLSIMKNITIEYPEKFLKSEKKCGYDIDTKIKKIWLVELDLLKCFIDVCNKYNLDYFAIGGTLLGAIRHNGFIPWDDDIDIVMPRSDYDKLLKLDFEFSYPYFLQSPLTEDNFWRSHIQLRNSETTGYTLKDININSNRGIFIDIFPLDIVPNDVLKRELHRKKLNMLRRIPQIAIKYSNKIEMPKKQTKLAPFINLFMKIIGYKKYFVLFNNVCKKYNNKNYCKIAHTTLSYRESVVWDKEDFSSYILKDFEFMKIRCPIGYNHILSRHYGKDYMEIPKRKNTNYHGEVIFNTDISYRQYQEDN